MTKIHGVIHGRIIELDSETDLPEGQEVSVIVQPVDRQSLPPGEGLRLSAGACADEAEAWDEFDKWYREERQAERRSIEDEAE